MVFGEVVEAIEDYLLYPKEDTYLFEVKSACVYLTLNKKYFHKVLNKAIAYYENRENYEMCSKCQHLLTTKL